MTREEEIKQAANEYILSDAVKTGNEYLAFGDFINGAKWADEHPSSEQKQKFVDKAVEWIKENITYTDNGIKKCLVNLGPFIDAIMEE